MTVAAVFALVLVKTCEGQGMLISLKYVFKSKVKLFTRLHLKQMIDVYLDVIRIKHILFFCFFDKLCFACEGRFDFCSYSTSNLSQTPGLWT